ncbi:MAG: STAS domain-containing protein [Candidatus Hydrogenedentes bacterium]|nr:STAS domain-containing protein [Candidatus Hydrogenedentota bacterium]
MSEAHDRIVEFEVQGKIVVGTIRTTSVLSAINVAEFGNEVVAKIEGNTGINLLLSFENVDYLSSAVLTELLRINKAIQEAQGQLRLCGVSKVILEIFQITNLDKMFAIYHDDVTGGVRRFMRSLEVAAEEAAWKDPM